jgi:glucokinase
MAKRTVVTESLTDDIDGTPAHRTVTFAYDGTSYEMELSNKNYTAFERAFRPYVSAARRIKKRSAAVGEPSKKDRAERYAAIRQWANENDLDVSARGRIAQEVIDAYDAAH